MPVEGGFGNDMRLLVTISATDTDPLLWICSIWLHAKVLLVRRHREKASMHTDQKYEVVELEEERNGGISMAQQGCTAGGYQILDG